MKDYRDFDRPDPRPAEFWQVICGLLILALMIIVPAEEACAQDQDPYSVHQVEPLQMPGAWQTYRAHESLRQQQEQTELLRRQVELLERRERRESGAPPLGEPFGPDWVDWARRRQRD